MNWWEAAEAKVDESTKSGDCRGRAQCAKRNPLMNRVEVYEWHGEGRRWWSMVAVRSLLIYKEQRFNDIRVVRLHPEEVGMVFLRCEDAIFVHDLRGRFEAARVCGPSPECGDICLVKGIKAIWKAAIAGKPVGFCSLHAHENVDGQEGEVFAVWLPPVNEI